VAQSGHPNWLIECPLSGAKRTSAAAGVPEPAKNSCAEIDIVNVAATTVAIVIRITSPT